MLRRSAAVIIQVRAEERCAERDVRGGRVTDASTA